MKFIMKLIREILGSLILFLDRLFEVQVEVKRSPSLQQQVQAATSKLVLYQLQACPFCVKVRRQIRKLGLSIETRNIDTDARSYDELIQGGQEDQVPCLRIETAPGQYQWMYESTDINQYLQQRFGQSG